MEKALFSLLLIGCGLFSLAGAVKNWDWFMEHRKARFMCSLLGRKGARIFYGLLGLIICGGGVAFLLGAPMSGG